MIDEFDHLIKNGMEDLAVRAADKTDDELWVNEYELSILGSMVSDVIEHPENYGSSDLVAARSLNVFT